MTSKSEERRRCLVDVPPAGALPDMITVRGARQNKPPEHRHRRPHSGERLQSSESQVPEKTSLAMGTLLRGGFAEAARGVEHLQPAATRPGAAPGRRSDRAPSGNPRTPSAPPDPGATQHRRTTSEVLNVLRLMMSRLWFTRLPERSPCRAVRFRNRDGDYLPRMWRNVRTSWCRDLRL